MLEEKEYRYFDLFPTRLYTFNLDVDNEKLIDDIISLSKKEKSVIKSNHGGWQSRANLIYEFPDLLSKIDFCFSQVMDKMTSQKQNFKIGGGWANINYQNDLNFIHNHPNSILSCAYYLQVPEDSDSGIIFEDPRGVTDYIHIPGEYKDINTINPVVGGLLIFPSWLKHMVKPNKSKKERISFSCNYGSIRTI